MIVILFIEMFAVLILGIAFIGETLYRHSLEKKIKTLNKLLQAKTEEINYLKQCQH